MLLSFFVKLEVQSINRSRASLAKVCDRILTWLLPYDELLAASTVSVGGHNKYF